MNERTNEGLSKCLREELRRAVRKIILVRSVGNRILVIVDTVVLKNMNCVVQAGRWKRREKAIA